MDPLLREQVMRGLCQVCFHPEHSIPCPEDEFDPYLNPYPPCGCKDNVTLDDYWNKEIVLSST